MRSNFALIALWQQCPDGRYQKDCDMVRPQIEPLVLKRVQWDTKRGRTEKNELFMVVAHRSAHVPSHSITDVGEAGACT